jgi:hypothetical protein
MMIFSRYRKSAYFYSAVLVIGASATAAMLMWSSMGSGYSSGSYAGDATIAESPDEASMLSPEVADHADKNESETVSAEALTTASAMQNLPLVNTEMLAAVEGSDQVSYDAWQGLSMNATASPAYSEVSGSTGSDLLATSSSGAGTTAGFGATGFSLVDEGGGVVSLPVASTGWAQSAGPGGMTGSMINGLTAATTGSPADVESDAGANSSGSVPGAGAAPASGTDQMIAALSPDAALFPTASTPALDSPAGTDANPRSEDPSNLFTPDVGVIEPGKTDGIDLAKIETGNPGTAKDEVTRPDNHPEASRSLIADVRQQTVDEPPAGLAIELGMVFFALRRRPQRP